LNGPGLDQKILGELIRFLDEKKPSPASSGQLALEIGRFFLGTPYTAGSLETKGAERFAVNLRGFDCMTFVESLVALAWNIGSRESSFEAFRDLLRKVRYRQGRLLGYPSRLHYFSDWVRDNQKKGIVRDVTAAIGGRPLRKVLNFMTAHPGLYPPLRDATILRKMKSVERAIKRRALFFIPKTILRQLEHRIHAGDLIGITTNIEGLDVQHVGLAARAKNRIHLLHASCEEGKVVLSKQTLYGYLVQSRTRTGVMVARISKTQRS